MSVADVDDSVARTQEAGGEVAVGSRTVSLGRVAAIVDPEGAVVGLARSSIEDPDDETTIPAAGRVVWTELLAAEPDAAAGFYRTVVGYDTRTIQRRGGEYILLAVNGADRAGILANPSQEAPPRWLTYFGVDDAADAAARAAALGGTIVLPVSPDLRAGARAHTHWMRRERGRGIECRRPGRQSRLGEHRWWSLVLSLRRLSGWIRQ